MASTAKIEEVGKGNAQSLASDLQDLLKEIDEFVGVNNQLLSSVRADRRRIAGEVLNLVDELVLKERCLKQVCDGRRRAERASRDAEAWAMRSKGQAERLWAALRVDWHAVEGELTCNICLGKLWSAVTIVLCGHTTCASCTYEWWRKCKEAPQSTYSCVRCGTTSDRHPLRALTIEGAVRELPRLNDDNRLLYEEAAKRVGYEDDSSWNDFFPKTLHFGDANCSFEEQKLNANMTQQDLKTR
ncbi:uncharacterized protein EV420DRAFT_1481549 [Desarmillaria tabescens]|uniref:RING-type domain-containing protein n=1 Tax=Armillaria tabescens TaxID=1929756 RepID=A0AA39N2Q5_ARMTA|nr:uncharacterized protein EV420DRAFT_1481549 [Desarmillaria tabescens]KAK0455313.1 hypothetical protein EV420DRAFT_1481549 [Desarmillaria tabescens]